MPRINLSGPFTETLICEGHPARSFEVAREGDLVWEWYNTIEEDGERVPVYRIMRYPAEMVVPQLVADHRQP